MWYRYSEGGLGLFKVGSLPKPVGCVRQVGAGRRVVIRWVAWYIYLQLFSEMESHFGFCIFVELAALLNNFQKEVISKLFDRFSANYPSFMIQNLEYFDSRPRRRLSEFKQLLQFVGVKFGK